LSGPPAGGGLSGPASPGGNKPRRGGWLLAAIVLLIAGAVSFGLGLGGNQPSLGSTLTIGSLAGKPKAVTPAVRSLPLTLTIPAIDLKTSLSLLGLNPNGTIQVPTSFAEAGWYSRGPSPGQLGSAVILGHVDSYRGPAVFFKLRDLRPGEHVDVTLADGLTTHFVVREIAMYPKAQFPTVLVYGSHGYSGLQLVTCGGIFNTQTGHYLSNVVVYTSLVGTN